MTDTINFFESLIQRLQHGALLADQTNDIAVRMIPHVEALKQAQNDDSNIIDVTPTQRTQTQTPVPYRPPAPPQEWGPSPQTQASGTGSTPSEPWNTPSQPQNRQPSQVPEAPEGFRWGQFPASEGH